MRQSFPTRLAVVYCNGVALENNQVRRPEIAGIRWSQFPVHTTPRTGPAMLPDLDADLKDRHP